MSATEAQALARGWINLNLEGDFADMYAAANEMRRRANELERPTSAARIRLTPIANELGGSNCSLFLDQRLRTFVGGWEYGLNEPWHIGINGQRYTLRQLQTGGAQTILVGARGTPRIVLTKLGTVRASTDPSYPMSIDRVSVSVTLGGRTEAVEAYRFCGEG